MADRLHWHLKLANDDLRLLQHAVNRQDVLRGQASIGARHYHNGVLTVGINDDQRNTAHTLRDSTNGLTIDVLGLQPFTQLHSIRITAYAPDHRHLCSQARRCHSLVRPLATMNRTKRLPKYCFSRARQALCAGDQIHVETANHHYVCLHVIETHPWDFRKDCTGAPT